MGVAISSIGLATAQGSTADISGGSTLRDAEQWPWPVNAWSTSPYCRPALGVSANLTGLARWQALIKMALDDCFGNHIVSPNTPIFLATCNGSAHAFDALSWRSAFDSAALLWDTPWSGQRLPVMSSSCNSGLHALYAAEKFLLSSEESEVVVLAADILSRSNQDNCESLRVLSAAPMLPWQPTSDGFILGEAAVALRLVREKDSEDSTPLTGPVLGSELTRDDGLPRVLEQFSAAKTQLVLGQGTGPFATDEAELAAFRTFVARDVPLATPLVHFGHTLGASGLLSVALAALIARNPDALATLVMPTPVASDGRQLAVVNNSANEISNVLVSCRALNGSCAAAVVGNRENSSRRNERARANGWQSPVAPGPLMHPTLRRLAAEALNHRPLDPPDVLVVKLEEPLAPPAQALIGGRLLPSAVLEITPGFVSQLIARSWGFAGPAICLVGYANAPGAASDSGAAWDLGLALNRLGLVMAEIHLRGTGEQREIAWNN